jgi:signal recognition particle subunit SEC65
MRDFQRKEGRKHVEDLAEMQPTLQEIEHAARWIRGWKSNAAFKKRPAFLVEGLGFPPSA